MTTIDIKAGERKRILSKFSNSMDMTYHFTVAATGAISGVVEVKGSNWLLPKQPVLQDLKADNAVRKGMWDTLFSVYVIPDTDVTITLVGSPNKRAWIYVSIIVLIMAATVGARILAGG